jgi:peptidoglycan L-alanyl-D-glutamate endopeptidase CwlK
MTPEKYDLTNSSKQRLKGVHPDLIKIVEKALEITDINFTILEGLRSKERQRILVQKGASKTMKSRHLTGHAVDIAPVINGQVTWDWKYYYHLEKIIKTAAKQVNIIVEWGGDWTKFKDGPHWQLPNRLYP